MFEGSDFETPLLLLAMPQVNDPFFRQAVVLLIRHEEDEGSLGFIVNRPMELTVSEILEDNEIEWTGEASPSAFFGGPVSPEMGTLLYRSAAETDDDDEVLPGVSASHSLQDLESLSRERPEAFRLFLGYAGWDSGQLEREIVRNDWLIAPVSNDLIFSSSPEEVWRRAVESVGIDPDHLPAFTQQQTEPAAN
ncbi:MAG: YqgE/AlgH family protein [Acidobacteriota bacterium]